MTTTLTVGKRGTIVIPKAIRAECHVEEGAKVDLTVDGNVILLSPSVQPRTRLDENFDRMREELTGRGVTLEAALQALREIKQSHG